MPSCTQSGAFVLSLRHSSGEIGSFTVDASCAQGCDGANARNAAATTVTRTVLVIALLLRVGFVGATHASPRDGAIHESPLQTAAARWTRPLPTTQEGRLTSRARIACRSSGSPQSMLKRTCASTWVLTRPPLRRAGANRH